MDPDNSSPKCQGSSPTPTPSECPSVIRDPPLSPTTPMSHDRIESVESVDPAEPVKADELTESDVPTYNIPFRATLLAGMDPPSPDQRSRQHLPDWIEQVGNSSRSETRADTNSDTEADVFLRDLQEIDGEPLHEPTPRFQDRYTARRRTILKAVAAVNKPAPADHRAGNRDNHGDGHDDNYGDSRHDRYRRHVRQESLPDEPPPAKRKRN